MSKASKKAKYVSTYNRGHWFPMQRTSPGEPLNNHQGRAGTKRNAGAWRCKCEYCTASKRPLLDSVSKKEFKNEINEIN